MPPGQPFRVHLWKILMDVIADPDASFLGLLPDGVPLGVDPAAPVPACPVLPLANRIPANRPPLTCCSSAWQSALSAPEAVDALLEEEIAAGWVQLVPGDVDFLRRTYTHCAVGMKAALTGL